MFVIIQPSLKEKGDKRAVLDLLSEKIYENISSNMTLTLIKIEDTYFPTKDCIELQGGGWESGEKVVVKNIPGPQIASTLSYPDLRVDWTSDKLLKIYSSPENLENLPLSSSDCAAPVEGSDFNIESIKKEKYAFELNLAKLKTDYESSYEELKTYLDVPSEEEFMFSFINSGGTISIEAGEEPSSGGIYSKDIPIIYVDNQAGIAHGVIRLKVW